MSVAGHVNYLSATAVIPNVNFDTRLVIPVNLAYLKMRLARGIEPFIEEPVLHREGPALISEKESR